MSSIKIESKIYLLNGTEAIRLDSLTHYIENSDVRDIQQIKLTNLNQVKNLPDKYVYFRLSSNYPVKIKIFGECEFISNYLEISFTEGKQLGFTYINPGSTDENIMIKFIGIKP